MYKIAYAEVIDIVVQESMVFGFHDGQKVSKHIVPFAIIYFTGGFVFNSISEPEPDGSIIADGMRIEIGDRFQVLALPGGTVKIMVPERTAHLNFDVSEIATVN